MSAAAAEWLASLDATADWSEPENVYLQINGYDIVGITDIDEETGTATVVVFDIDEANGGFPKRVAEVVINLRKIIESEET